MSTLNIVVDRAVISQLDSDTVLFVLGDHGMTATGDHGGDSFDELDATLFVYSSSVISDAIPQQVCRSLPYYCIRDHSVIVVKQRSGSLDWRTQFETVAHICHQLHVV